MAEISGFGLSSPTPQRDPDRSASLGRQLQAARGCHGKPRHLTENRPEATMAQPFLHAGQHGLVITGFEIDYAIGREAGLSDCRREKIRTSDAPEDFALCASCDPRAEQSGCSSINRAVPPSCDLMQGAKRQPATGES